MSIARARSIGARCGVPILNDNGEIPASTQEDAILARLVSTGDVTAFTVIYDRYVTSIYSMAAHLLGATDADEIVQEVFLQLWLKADQYDASRGTFRGWFMTVARNRVIRELRNRSQQKRAQTSETIDHILSRTPDTSVDVEQHAWLSDQSKVLAAELSGLPAEQRRVLVLAYFGGLSQSAIARYLDIPLGTVKKRTSLGMQKLRRALAPGQRSGLDVGRIDEDDSISPATKARLTDGL